MELRWYYSVLRRWWQIIVAGALLAMLAALLASLLLPRTYTATANVLLLKGRVDITIDPRLSTLSEDEIVRLTNPDVRRLTLSALAVSGAVLEQTAQALPVDMQADWTVARLAQRVSIKTAGNILQLSVDARRAAESALVVNTWAETFIAFSNAAYRQGDLGSVTEEQLQQALADYQTTQDDLEAFLSANEIDELTLAINVREQVVQNIRTSFQTATINSLNDQLGAKQRIPLLLESAQALRQQLATSPGAQLVQPSTQVALIILEANALTSGVTLPAQLQLDLTTTNPETVLTAGDAVNLVDGLIAAMGNLQQSLSETTLADSTSLLDTPDLDSALANSIDTLQTRLDELRAQLEAQLARRRELTALRDLRWDSYQIVLKQSAESNLLSTAADTEVIIAAPAIVPPNPSAPNILVNIVTGALLGLMGTLVYAFAQSQINGVESADPRQRAAEADAETTPRLTEPGPLAAEPGD